MEDHEEDPGTCPYCGQAFQIVRPGKSQPTCDCQDEVSMTRHQQRLWEQERDLMRAMLEGVKALSTPESGIHVLAKTGCEGSDNIRRKREGR